MRVGKKGTKMLLSKPQARAVFDAMQALNNVNGIIETHFGYIKVWEVSTGSIYVYTDSSGSYCDEAYSSQTEFAEAYGLLNN